MIVNYKILSWFQEKSSLEDTGKLFAPKQSASKLRSRSSLSSSGSEKSQSEKSLSSYEIQSKSKISSFGLNFKPKKLLKSVTKGKVRILWVVALWGYSHRFGVIVSDLLTFYLINSMNFNKEFPTLMIFCLLQGYII